MQLGNPIGSEGKERGFMSTSYNEMQAVLRIDSIITLIQNMNEKHGEDAAHSLDEYIINELKEVKKLLQLDES